MMGISIIEENHYVCPIGFEITDYKGRSFNIDGVIRIISNRPEFAYQRSSGRVDAGYWSTIEIDGHARTETDQNMFDTVYDDICPGGFFPCYAEGESQIDTQKVTVTGMLYDSRFTATGHIMYFPGDYQVIVQCDSPFIEPVT